MFDLTITALEVAAPVLGWLLLSPRFAEPVYHPALFEPHKFPKGNWNTGWLPENMQPADAFFFNDRGSKLHGWLFERPGAKSTVILNHGKTGNVSDMNVLISLLLRSAANLFVYDYSGYGKSEGKPSVLQVCEDAVSAYDYISTRFPDTNIVEFGESLGGSIAVYVAQRRDVSALILQSAFFDMRRIASETYPIFKIWPQSLFAMPYFDAGGALQKLPCPVLIVHGEKDVDVHTAHGHDLFAVAKEPKQLLLLPNTAHEEIAAADWDLFADSVAGFVGTNDSRAIKAPRLVLASK